MTYELEIQNLHTGEKKVKYLDADMKTYLQELRKLKETKSSTPKYKVSIKVRSAYSTSTYSYVFTDELPDDFIYLFI